MSEKILCYAWTYDQTRIVRVESTEEQLAKDIYSKQVFAEGIGYFSTIGLFRTSPEAEHRLTEHHIAEVKAAREKLEEAERKQREFAYQLGRSKSKGGWGFV